MLSHHAPLSTVFAAQRHCAFIPVLSHDKKKLDTVNVESTYKDFRSNTSSALGVGTDDDDKTERLFKHISNTRHSSDAHRLPATLISTVSILGLGSSLGTLWSEYAVITTGCGPMQLSDFLERGFYLGTLVIAGLSVFTRIVVGDGISIALMQLDNRGRGSESFQWQLQLQIAEIMSLIAVLMAFVALGVQEYNGEKMDGLSGINIDMCRAMQTQEIIQQ